MIKPPYATFRSFRQILRPRSPRRPKKRPSTEATARRKDARPRRSRRRLLLKVVSLRCPLCQNCQNHSYSVMMKKQPKNIQWMRPVFEVQNMLQTQPQNSNERLPLKFSRLQSKYDVFQLYFELLKIKYLMNFFDLSLR